MVTCQSDVAVAGAAAIAWGKNRIAPMIAMKNGRLVRVTGDLRIFCDRGPIDEHVGSGARMGCKLLGLNFLEYLLQPVQHLEQQRGRNVECGFYTDGACLRIRSRDQHAAAKQARSTVIADRIRGELEADEQSLAATGG